MSKNTLTLAAVETTDTREGRRLHALRFIAQEGGTHAYWALEPREEGQPWTVRLVHDTTLPGGAARLSKPLDVATGIGARIVAAAQAELTENGARWAQEPATVNGAPIYLDVDHAGYPGSGMREQRRQWEQVVAGTERLLVWITYRRWAFKGEERREPFRVALLHRDHGRLAEAAPVAWFETLAEAEAYAHELAPPVAGTLQGLPRSWVMEVAYRTAKGARGLWTGAVDAGDRHAAALKARTLCMRKRPAARFLEHIRVVAGVA